MVIKSEGRDASDFFFVATRGVIEALYIGRIAFLSYGDDRKRVDVGVDNLARYYIFLSIYLGVSYFLLNFTIINIENC